MSCDIFSSIGSIGPLRFGWLGSAWTFKPIWFGLVWLDFLSAWLGLSFKLDQTELLTTLDLSSEVIRVEDFFLSLKISTHNINGLKSNPNKLTNLMEHIIQQKIDVCTLTDTNLMEREGFFTIPSRYKDTYRIFWASRDLEKMKGSGVACIVNQKWAKHHWETVVFSPYLLNVKFLFQNLQLNIWTIYTMPLDPLILQNSFDIIAK